MNNNLRFYQQNQDSLIEQYDSVSFESVHHDWLELLPSNGTALDIGAGSGRDARYMAERGLKVYAAEPSLPLMAAALENSKHHDIVWFQDSLPSLENTSAFNTQFDVILLSAVWMHLSPEERKLSMQNMSSLLNVGGKLVITLRHGKFYDGRSAYPLSVDEVVELASSNGLALTLKTDMSSDKLGRGEVVWQTVVLGK
jgi:SAM-dependent methyltransferase